MFEKIIVPLDGSITAEVALPYAEESAARTGTELILLCVKETDDFRSENMLQAYLDSLAQKAKEHVKDYLKESEFKELKTSTKILTGDPAEEIVKFAESQPSSRLIMATHGKSGHGTRWVLGSVANKVTKAVTRPITLIRAHKGRPEIHGASTLKSILVTVDGTKGAEAALPYAKEIALTIKAQVTFLHILVKELVTFKMIEVPISEERRNLAKDYLEKLVADFKKDGISADYAIWETRGDVGGEIVEYTEKKYVDLVVMVAQGHSGLRYWGIGSVTNKVISEGNAAVMVVKAS